MSENWFDEIEGLRSKVEILMVQVMEENPTFDFPQVIARAAATLALHMRAGGASEQLVEATGKYVMAIGADIAKEVLGLAISEVMDQPPTV